MKSLKITIAATLLAACVITSCTKTVDDIAPVNLIDENAAVTDSVTVERSILGTYSALQSGNYYGLSYLMYQDLYADNITFSGTFTTHAEFAAKTINASNLQVLSTWGSIYTAIGRANWLLSKIDAVPILDATKNRYKGEARFVRALAYFDLVKVFGGVPLVLTPTTTKEAVNFAPRATEAQVYDQIIADLQFAEANIPTTLTAQTRATVRGARALLARVYLQRGDYANAYAKADQVITGNGAPLQQSYSDIFVRENTTETIFAVNYTINDQNGLSAATNPAVGGQKFYASANLDNSFLANDVRKAGTVRVVSGVRTMNKYPNFASSDNDVQVLRTAELYLIRAEAAARQGVQAAPASPQVISDINMIRVRAGLTPIIVGTMTNAQALTEILNQRRWEFAHEGLRFMDLKRYGLAYTGANAYKNLWPIPTTERQNNPALTQNPGY
jgi:tetratricopeptide (TPR) repeat protein